MTISVSAPTGESLSYEIPIMKLKNYDCNIILEEEAEQISDFCSYPLEQVKAIAKELNIQ